MRHFQKKRQGFWNKEYKKGEHFALSAEPSEDLVKFLHWLLREKGEGYLRLVSVLDLGCGNGRNLVYLAKEFGAKGIGIDSSNEAIAQAKKMSVGLSLEYKTASIANQLPVADESQTLVLDMMTSHFLKKEERMELYKKIARVLKSGGWLFLKTFLMEDDRHAARLLREYPADEPGSYVHPKFGGVEHVFMEEEIRKDLAPYFDIEKITKSHRHRGPAAKRRSMCVYARKIS